MNGEEKIEDRGQKGEGRGESIDLFTYDCADGTVRTRCRRHIAVTGPYRMIGKKPYHVRHQVSWERCVECNEEYERVKRRKQGHKHDTVIDKVDE